MDNRLQPSLDSGNGDVPGKTAVRGSHRLRDYDGQVAEAMALVRALNKMTKAGMLESVYCLKIQPATGSFARNLIYSTKPSLPSHGDVLMWLMNTTNIRYVNKRWVGHIEYYMTINTINDLESFPLN